MDLFADRTSAATMHANQLRLWFASFAYVLLCALRRIGLVFTQFARASCGSIRLKLLKIGALAKISVRRIHVAMASACPYQHAGLRIFQLMSQIRTRSAGTPSAPFLPARYTRTAIVLHWVIAALIGINVLLGLTVDALPNAWTRPAIDLHKSFGLTVLGLVVVRILWRLSHPVPPLPSGYRRLERAVAHGVHILLYGLILLLPISGWLHDSAFKDAAAHPLRLFWIIPWFRIAAMQDLPAVPKEALHGELFALHAWSVYALGALVALHIVGALKHQFIDRHAEFQRMGLG